MSIEGEKENYIPFPKQLHNLPNYRTQHYLYGKDWQSEGDQDGRLGEYKDHHLHKHIKKTSTCRAIINENKTKMDTGRNIFIQQRL